MESLVQKRDKRVRRHGDSQSQRVQAVQPSCKRDLQWTTKFESRSNTI